MEPANAHLGIDLILGGDGELALSPSGDVAVTQDGRDALAQDICNLLETLPGDLFSHAEFGAGLGRLLGDTQQNHEERISRAVTDALAYHPSVASRLKTNTIKVTVEGFGKAEFQVQLESVPIGGGAQSPLNLVFRMGAEGLALLA